MDTTITSHSSEETILLGRSIGRQLRGGEIFAICGPLGSGKTHLIKGIATGAGAEDRKAVTSPTFVIVNQYAGRFDLYHIDAYRLDSVAEFEMLGFDDFCYGESVVLIEWADKVEAALHGVDCIGVELRHVDEHTRTVDLRHLPAYLRVS
ncbi:MAG: tRNA (adenosine(37)-N6)-threonylcarbamoyltransferase complex ATPase subunit type 1 TsaE [Sedimentisphaerales bacterium]|nr:tRNA (adenosine(37)-N6)-threonylcarbamoyltransferase complex ATPase subunit type 1 TsaE [Sedimentisphaerales bacterium]